MPTHTSGVAHSLPWIAPVIITVGLPLSLFHEASSVIRMAVMSLPAPAPSAAPTEPTTAKPDELSARSVKYLLIMELVLTPRLAFTQYPA